jgi:glycosyltransferase involved in cell wall biosynthesis
MSSARNKVPVSILVPIKNEAANLPRCLASAAWADEIYVVDSHSTDGSQAIAESFGAKVVQFDFSGTWPKKKNWALQTLPWANEWVFVLDADEVFPPEAEPEIRAIVQGEGVEALPAERPAGYWVSRRFQFMGKWLQHAYRPNWNLRLFKHSLGRYEKLTGSDTGSGDNEVHEHVIVKGTTGHLKFELDHYAFPSVDVFVEKHNRYSNWEAAMALDSPPAEEAATLQRGSVSWLRRLRRLSLSLPLRPLLRFLYVYIYQKGFLDGLEGYYFARLHGFYEFLIVAKTHELKQQRRRGQK